MKTLRLSKNYYVDIEKTLDGISWFGTISDSVGRILFNTGLEDSEHDVIEACQDWLDNLRSIL